MNLYDITTGLRAVHDQINDAGGELTPDLEASLDSLGMELTVKAQNIGKWIINVGADEKAIQAEIERLTAKKEGRANLKRRLKDYIRDCMITVGRTKIESPAVTVRVQKNPPSVEIESEDAIPARFKVVIPATEQVDKKKLLDALKAGEDVEGARLVKDRYHLRIR